MPDSRHTPNQYPPLDRIMQVGADEAGNLAATAQALDIAPTSLRSHLQATGEWAAFCDLRHQRPADAGGANLTSDDPAEWGDIRALLERRGLKPDEWIVRGARVNEWADQRQLRVDLSPREEVIYPV